MRRHLMLVAVSSLALAGVAGSALAQSAQPLAAGASINAALGQGDATGPDDAYIYDDYAVTARAGQRFEAAMRARDFDAYLEVFSPGQADEPMGFDDDGLEEGQTHARLRFTAPTDGVYLVRARTLSGVEGGDYSLSLTARGTAPRPPRPAGIRLGQNVRGDLSDRDPEADSGYLYDAYAFRARGGERFSVALDSEAFDPVVRVGRMNGPIFEELAQNDDGPDAGLNSRLIFTAPDAGDYLVRVSSLNSAGRGGYSLRLEQGPPPIPAEPIQIGGTVQGQLSEGDGKSAGGTPADAYRFQGAEGQRIRIDMTSSDFDTYLELFDGNRVSLASDDDGGPEGTDSRLTFTLPRTGEYIIEARAFADGVGDYELSVSELQPDKAPDSLPFGSTIQGEIGEEDSRDNDDRGFDAYTFSGREGQRVQAIMRSGDFDTYLQVGSADGEFKVLASDDDGLREGTDSRLNFTLPEDGEYVLRASPLGSSGKGLYSLELIDRGPQPQPGSVLIGTTARGVLTENDATADDNSYFDAYRITVREDEKLVLTMVSNELDSLIVIGREKSDGSFEVLASDDDGLSDTHSKLEWTAPADGAYEIRASAYQQGQTGAYALAVEKQP